MRIRLRARARARARVCFQWGLSIISIWFTLSICKHRVASWSLCLATQSHCVFITHQPILPVLRACVYSFFCLGCMFLRQIFFIIRCLVITHYAGHLCSHHFSIFLMVEWSDLWVILILKTSNSKLLTSKWSNLHSKFDSSSGVGSLDLLSVSFLPPF